VFGSSRHTFRQAFGTTGTGRQALIFWPTTIQVNLSNYHYPFDELSKTGLFYAFSEKPYT
jgi:hypothetical protein